jgi:hypothetical protein
MSRSGYLSRRRDRAITLNALAQAHEPLPDFPALCPAAVTLALPSMAPAPVFPSPVVPMAPTSEALDNETPVLALCPMVLPMAFSLFVPDDSVHRWLTSALSLVPAPVPDETPGISVVTAPKARKPKTTGKQTTTAKNLHKRLPKTAAAAL